jgi:HEAT repeat protein
VRGVRAEAAQYDQVSRSPRKRTRRRPLRADRYLPRRPRTNHVLWPALGFAALFILGLASWGYRTTSSKDEPDIKAVANKDPVVRIKAIQRIAQGPMSDETLPAIRTCLSDPDTRVRQWAVTAIARVDPRTSLIPLLQALADSDEAIRELASESLATLNASPEAETAWRQAFGDSMQSVRLHAVEHIDVGATPETLRERLRMALDDASAEIRAAVAMSLAGLTSEQYTIAIPLLLAHLDSDDPNVREGVLAALHDRSIPADMVPLLLGPLRSNSAEVRHYALMTLAKLNRPDAAAASPLCALLSDRALENRELASAALVKLGSSAVPVLRLVLRSPDRQARMEAIHTLAAIGTTASDSVPDLVVLLDDWSAQVRAEAASALGGMGQDAQVALTALAGHFSDPDESVRRQSLDAALKIGPRAFMAAPLLAALDSDDIRTVHLAALAIGRLGELDESAVPALRRALTSPRLDSRLFAMKSLASLGDKARDAVPELRAALSDKDARIREQALGALSRLGSGPGSIAALAAALTAADSKLRDGAALALNRATYVDSSAIAPLMQALASRVPGTRQIAARSLGKAGASAKDATGTLEHALKDSDVNVRREAATALGHIGLPAWRAVPLLGSALEDHSMSVRRAAVGALAELAPRATNTVHYLLGAARQPELRGQAFQGLVAAGPGAVPDLLVAIDNKEQYDARMLALAALAKLGPDAHEATETLEFLARRHPYPALRQTAAYALRSVLGEQPPGVPAWITASLEDRRPPHRPARQKAEQAAAATGQMAGRVGPAGPQRAPSNQ